MTEERFPTGPPSALMAVQLGKRISVLSTLQQVVRAPFTLSLASLLLDAFARHHTIPARVRSLSACASIRRGHKSLVTNGFASVTNGCEIVTDQRNSREVS